MAFGGVAGVTSAARRKRNEKRKEKRNQAKNRVVENNVEYFDSVASELSEDNKTKTTPFKCFRHACGDFINDPRSQNIMIALIVLNSLMMGVGTFAAVRENPEAHEAFEKTDLAFLIVFTIELALQIVFHGYYLFLDGWLTFDFIIIILSWAFHSLTIIRAFRIFRALRLITRVKSMKQIVSALLDAIPRMLYIGVLLGLIFYIFGVMFTTLFKDTFPMYTSENYFYSLDLTVFTLFQIMTMDNWAEICREVQSDAQFWWAWLPFMTFISITGFVVVNLIIAVICDSISNIREEDEICEKAQEENNKIDTDSHGASIRMENAEYESTQTNRSEEQKQIDDLVNVVEDLLERQDRTQLMLTYVIRQLQVANLKK